jgi:uncharacterized protein (TIGR03435 family)
VDKPLTFDAASVKPSEPLAMAGGSDGSGEKGVTIVRKQPGAFRSGGPGTNDPGRIHYPHSTLKNLLVEAYDVARFQIQGPGWLDTGAVDIDATMPPQTTREQFHAMLQNLMVERFKLAMHRETKEFAGYTLVVAKSGPNLKEALEIPAAPDGGSQAPVQPPAGPGRYMAGSDGFPTSLPLGRGGRGGRGGDSIPGFFAAHGWRMYFQQKSMRDLANYLRERLQRPVTDATALASKYDFTLTFLPEDWPVPPDARYPPAPIFSQPCNRSSVSNWSRRRYARR